MSAGVACKCGNRDRWVVAHYAHNHSWFNGGLYTASEYSEMRCDRCRARWRTKAAYVDELEAIRGAECL